MTCDGRLDGALLESTPAPRHHLETPSSAGDVVVPPLLVPNAQAAPKKAKKAAPKKKAAKKAPVRARVRLHASPRRRLFDGVSLLAFARPGP